MKTLDSAYILAKNQLYSKEPWIILFEIAVDDDTTWRLAAYPEDVTWNSETWTKFPAAIENINEGSEGRLEGLNIHVANVNRTVSAYVENNNLLGRDVVVYIIYKGEIDVTSDILSFTYRVNRIQVSEQSALFELGHEDLFALQLPWQRYIRDKCRFVYKDDCCRYPNDEFDAITQQDFLVGGDGVKGAGWTLLNYDAASECDINITFSGDLSMRLLTDAAYDWDGATQDGPYLYKTLSGDFDLNIYETGSYLTDYGWLFLLQSTSDTSDWYGSGKTKIGATTYRLYRNTVNDVSSDTTSTTNVDDYYMRITRVGSAITVYTRTLSADSWEQVDTETRGDFPAELRIGFALYCTGSGIRFRSRFHFFRVTSGGFASCDYTLDGLNGCRIHQNTNNFGACPGLPVGRLHGI